MRRIGAGDHYGADPMCIQDVHCFKKRRYGRNRQNVVALARQNSFDRHGHPPSMWMPLSPKLHERIAGRLAACPIDKECRLRA